MKFFYNWCARIAKKHQESMQSVIQSKTNELSQARFFSDLCDKAMDVTNSYKSFNRRGTLSANDIEILVKFVELKAGGSRVCWRSAEQKCEEWFTEHGLEIPSKPLTSI